MNQARQRHLCQGDQINSSPKNHPGCVCTNGRALQKGTRHTAMEFTHKYRELTGNI